MEDYYNNDNSSTKITTSPHNMTLLVISIYLPNSHMHQEWEMELTRSLSESPILGQQL